MQQAERKSTTHDERFMHIRDLHLISDKYSAATVFTRRENDGIWYASIALCWKADQFSREIGRQNARRHYFNRPIEARIRIGGEPSFEFAELLATQHALLSYGKKVVLQ